MVLHGRVREPHEGGRLCASGAKGEGPAGCCVGRSARDTSARIARFGGARYDEVMNQAEIGLELEIFACGQARLGQNGMNIMWFSSEDWFTATRSNVRRRS